jgi:ElaA protein
VTGPSIREARFAELSPSTLYDILRLRVDVFVVEQECTYPDLDGRDVEPGTVHMWIDDPAGKVLAYLRVLDEGDDERRIGRVVTAAEARNGGLAERLVRHALEHHCPGPVVLAAQSYLAAWYGRLGFAPSGGSYIEDGIEHVPMSRP